MDSKQELDATPAGSICEHTPLWYEDHPTLGMVAHANEQCAQIEYKTPLMQVSLADTRRDRAAFCPKCISGSTPSNGFVVTHRFAVALARRLGPNFTVDLVERHGLHDFATRWARDYDGDLAYMQRMRSRSTSRLSSEEARGVMNCFANDFGATLVA